MPERIALVRESGALGDVLNVATVAGLLVQQGHEVDVWTLPQYQHLWHHFRNRVAGTFRPLSVQINTHRRGRLIPLPDAMEAWRRQTLRPAGHYFEQLDRAWKDYDRVVDLFCPGYRYEMSEENPTKGRLTCFAEAAGIEVPDPVVFPVWDHLYLPVSGLDAGTIGLALDATDPARSYPFSQARQLIRQLLGSGFSVVVFELTRRVALGGAEERYTEYVGRHLDAVARALGDIRLLVSVESGLHHLAGLLGVPTLVLCGATDPAAQIRHYPNADGFTAFGWNDPALAGRLSPCRSPCWFRKERGWDDVACRRDGCFWMHSIEPSRVVERVIALAGA